MEQHMVLRHYAFWYCKIASLFLFFRTAEKMKFSIKDFFSKCDQIRRKLRIWSHLLKKSLMENFIICVVSTNGDFFKSFHVACSVSSTLLYKEGRIKQFTEN